jgi:hypothetical protein
MAREQLNTLTYSELAALAVRLTETAETIRNPALYADLHQAAGAVSDLASIKFGIEEIAKIAMEIEDRVRCREATLAPVDVVKDESFSTAADSISAKIRQDDLIEACMLAKGWPKK